RRRVSAGFPCAAPPPGPAYGMLRPEAEAMSMSKTGSARLASMVAVLGALLAAPEASANRYHVGVRGGGTLAPGRTPAVRIYRPPVYVGTRVWGPSHTWYRPYPYFGYRYYYAYPYPYYYSYGYVRPAPAYYYAPPAEGAVYARAVREPTIGLGVRGSTLRAAT